MPEANKLNKIAVNATCNKHIIQLPTFIIKISQKKLPGQPDPQIFAKVAAPVISVI